MLEVTVHITGLDVQKERLAKLRVSLEDFTGAFTTLSTQLIHFFSDTVFISRGQALGRPWASLKPKTVTEKLKKWPGRGILQRSGDLQGGFYPEITRSSLFIGNRMDYFPYQQLGTATGPGRGHNIPARPMLGVNDTVVTMIKTVIEEDVRAKIAAVNA